jgi:PBSX family phage terminase large subunit
MSDLAALLSPSAQTAYRREQVQLARKKSFASASRSGYVPRGGSEKMWNDNTSREILISGPAGTGKSRGCLEKIHYYASNYKHCRMIVLRKTRASTTESALVTFEQYVTGPEHPMVTNMHRRNRQAYQYPNGSTIVVGGLDYPTRLFSTEFDMIYVQEATELNLNEYESLLRCLRNNKLPFQQLIADCNPDAPEHWLKVRCDQGRATYIESHHEDNPLLYDAEAEKWTDVGVAYIDTLDALTGVRKERLRYGRWTLAEGAIYDNWSTDAQDGNISAELAAYDPDLPIYWLCDDGYQNPRVVLIAQKKRDGAVAVIDEYYMAHQLFDQTLGDLLARPYHKPSAAIYDPSALTFAAEVSKRGIATVAANNDVADGIKVVRDYICDGKGVRSLYINPRCKNLIREIPSYRYADTASVAGGDPRPIKENDHACDALRYGLVWFKSGAGVQVRQLRSVGLTRRTTRGGVPR